MAKHYFGENTVTLVCLKPDNTGKLVVAWKKRISGQADIKKHFAVDADGIPAVGPRVYRELTASEMKEQGLPPGLKTTSCVQCLIAVGIIQETAQRAAA